VDQEKLRKHRARRFLRVKLWLTAEIFAILAGISAIPAAVVGWVIASTLDVLFVVVFLMTLLAGIPLLMFLLILSMEFARYWFPGTWQRELGFIDPNAKPERPSIVRALRETVNFMLLKGLYELWCRSRD
jgi:hypothetical protein